MLGLLIGAGVLGLIIAVMEKDEFPGWGKMFLCVLVATIPAALINAVLPPYLFIIGTAIGALCAGLAISFFCGMSVPRATTAAGIYLGAQVALELGFRFLASTG